MTKKKRLIVLFLLLSAGGYGQIFPVQVNVQLVPPYSPYLSDYTAPGSQHLIVHIRTNDLTLSNYPCKLRLTIEGVGITVQTKQNFAPQPLILDGGGLPQIFYGEDLHEYLHPDALDFEGLTRREFERSAMLPEGVYRFTIEVLDYHRGTAVSNKGVAVAWIMLNDPPLLNLPANFSKLAILDPTNILFSWTPRHTGSPNAAFSTEYTFRLTEIWPEGRNPNDAIASLPPLYEVATTQNHLVYGPGEPALIAGRKYAWQVEARDTGGKDLFKNSGRSEVFVFQFGDAMPTPENLQLRWAKPTTLAIRWDRVKISEGEEIKYRLTYRPRKRVPDPRWYETRTKFTEKTLYDLQPETEYEFKIRAETETRESEYSETRIFKTLRREKEAFVCRDVEPPPTPENTLPVFPLSINDTIRAGGYDVLVRDVMAVNGKYSGSGFAIVPWFNAAKVRVTFENIRVNDQFWLTGGIIKSVWNAESKFLIEEEKPVLPGKAPQAGALDITVIATDSLVIIEGAVQGTAIAAVTQDEEGNIVVTTTDGGEQRLEKGVSYAVVDDVGNGYVIDKHGNIAKTTATAARATATRGDRDYHLSFQFAKGHGRFGLDAKRFEALAHYYQQLENGVYVGWKALSSAAPDVLDGHYTSGMDVSYMQFEAGSIPLTPVSSGGGQVTLNLQGKAAGLEEELLARYKPTDTLAGQVIGKLNLVTYDPVHYNLVIVPVNDASIPGGLSAYVISGSLNYIFNQAVVDWSVSIADRIHVPLGATFDEGEAGVFSNYTEDMKKVLNAWGRFEHNTYYLFLVDEPRNMATLGYMPRGRQAGFVFIAPHHGNTEEFLKTLAHELGHGTFNLKHTFNEHNLPASTTDNLMDYSSGTALYKYQWDHIHQPEGGLRLFEGEGEMRIPIETYVTEFSLHASYYIVENGLIPEYLWRSGQLNPVAAGFVDGMWQTIEGTWGIANFLKAWQPGNSSAEALQIRISSWRFVQFLNDLVTSSELRTQTWKTLQDGFKGYIDETVAFDNQGLYNQGKLVFDVIAMFLGVGEIKAILNGQKITVGIVSLLNAVPKNLSTFTFKIKQLGLSVAKTGDDIVIKDGTTEIAHVANNLIAPKVFFQDGQQMLIHEGHTLVKNNQGKFGFLAEIIDDLSKAWKVGWNQQKILAIPKGQRPDPKTYLHTSYITNHLNQFARGVTKITSYAPKGVVGPPGGTYVIPKPLADDLINRADSDVKKLEELLGLERGSLGDKPFRVDVADPSNLRMPSGNEIGANSNWVPAGRTSGGVLEATTDSFQPGTYISKPVF